MDADEHGWETLLSGASKKSEIRVAETVRFSWSSSDETLTVATLRKAVKELTDVKEEFAKGARADLVAANENEIRVLEKHLPKGIDGAALEAIVTATIAETGALSKRKWARSSAR